MEGNTRMVVRKKRRIAVAVLAVLLLIVSGCSPEVTTNGDGGQRLTLNFATFWPGEDYQIAEGHHSWAAEIESRVLEETDHTVQITFHSGGSLLGATEIYEGVALGAADIGSTCPSYTPGIFRASSVLELPGFNNPDALTASLTIQEAYETIEEIQKEYSDVKVMHFWATGPGDILSTVPVESLEDLSGMEIRVASGSVPAIEALGARPVSMPMSESYLALNQGIVKGLLGPTDILRGFRLAEVTDYIIKTPWLYNVVFVKVMNQNTWDSLPEDVQQIFDEVNAKYVTEYGKLRTSYTEEGQQYAADNYGHQIVTLSEEEEARWIEALSSVQEQWVSDMDRYQIDGKGLLEQVNEIDERLSQE